MVVEPVNRLFPLAADRARWFLAALLIWLACVPATHASRSSVAVPRPCCVESVESGASVYDGFLSAPLCLIPRARASGVQCGCRPTTTIQQRIGVWLNGDPLREGGGINLYQFCGNNPISRTDPFGLAPGDLFDTYQDAAIDAMQYIYPLTQTNKIEYFTWIITTNTANGCFTYINPIPGTEMAVTPSPQPTNAVATAHSHTAPPKGFWYFIAGIFATQEDFSRKDEWSLKYGGDVRFADDHEIPSYLVTPSGVMKLYSPDPSKRGKGVISEVGDVKTQRSATKPKPPTFLPSIPKSPTNPTF